MGNLKDYLAARANGTVDEYALYQYQRYSTRTLNFVGFGRHVIDTQDAEIIRDIQNHVRCHKVTMMTALSYHILL